MELIAQGIGIARGTACGKASVLASAATSELTLEELMLRTKSRYRAWSMDPALPRTAQELALVYLALLEDPDLWAAICGHGERRGSVEAAVTLGCEERALALENAQHPYLRERADDLRKLAKEILSTAVEDLKGDIWLVGEISPNVIYKASAARVRAIITKEYVSTACHLAILARTLGLVLVANVSKLELLNGREITADGSTGEIWEGMRLAGEIEIDCEPFPLWLNAASAKDIASAKGYKGIGLFRTEFLYLERGLVPPFSSEKEAYSAAVRAAGGKTVIFRLLDVGSDKPLAGVTLDHEPNPMLGERGIRVLLRRPDILEQQLLALISAATHGPVQVMVPMVSDLREIIRIRELLKSLGGGHLPLGAMLETPAAVLMVRELCEVADFFSLGTNDLSAYVYATDRAGHMSELPDGGEALFRLVGPAVKTAKSLGRDVGVCGELASLPAYALRFLDLGCSYLSMTARAFPSVAQALGTESQP